MYLASIKALIGSKTLGKALSGGTMLSFGMDAFVGMSTYNQSKAEGDGKVTSVAKAAGEIFMAHTLSFGGYIGLQALTAAPKWGVQGYENLAKMSRTMTNQGKNMPFANANFIDSQQAYTMRQAGMKLAKASKYNQQQSMLGNEAQYLHL
jgi:hypothetical protein